MGGVMIICKYAIAIMWLILVVSVSGIVAEPTGGFTRRPAEQYGLNDQLSSPDLIRPPPPSG